MKLAYYLISEPLSIMTPTMLNAIKKDININTGYPNPRLPDGYNTKVKPKNLIGRNDRCSCNSGKKYKHCCLKK